MATSYQSINLTAPATANNIITAENQTHPAIVANAARTHFLTAWTNGTDGVMGRLYDASGNPVTNEFAISLDTTLDQKDVSLAALNDGRFIATYTDNDDIRARIINADGSLAQIIDVSTVAKTDRFSDVTALSDGGFVVTWARFDGNYDIYASVFNADGSLRDAAAPVNSNPNTVVFSSVAGLAGGGYIVAWEEPTGIQETEVRFRRFDANGNALDGTVAQGVLIDNWGDTNRGIQVAALPDGGFVVAYTDDGWLTGDGLDITAQVYNANGTPRSSSSFVNTDLKIGDQRSVSLGVMDDGHFFVSWFSHDRQRFQTYDKFGNKLGGNEIMAVNSVGGEIAVLKGSVIAQVFESTDTDGSGTSMKTDLIEFRRVLSGSGANETINGHGDSVAEIILGKGGHDTLNGGAGRDMFEGGLGNDLINGGTGDDTARFSGYLDKSTIYDFGSKIVVVGPDGFDQLTSIEHLDFDYAHIDIVNDGSGLFDTLYYLSTNLDVFSAGVNALEHFNTYGWHEGRDPNAFFDASGYLAVNKDIAAAGVNPLEHYHQFGWHEGRDPSADFDTTLYLLRNPDVAAAGIDPLEHFLQFGFAEGRSSHFAIGDVVNGFDAQYYLFHNPDVAAAGVDPLAHFNAFGWHEGRNPNAYFNTVGYLSHYADVAAAGVNPLQHYEQYGWQEGRDPNAYFDTLGYLAANPDVAAAHVNPLDHFLQHGIYEGRSVVADGLWH